MNDDDLRRAFAELRRIESRAPKYAVPAPGRRLSRWRVGSVLAFALVLLLVVIGVAILPHHHPLQPSITEWRAPTDFLLKTPGHELLDSVPDLKGHVR